MQAFIVRLLELLPGALAAEVNLTRLLEVIVEVESLALSTGHYDVFLVAVQAIEKNADSIFVGHGWFKDLALELLNHVATKPVLTVRPA